MKWGFMMFVVVAIVATSTCGWYFYFISGHFMVEHIDPVVVDKISLVVLNYNRPSNLVKNLPYFSKMDILKEILVSHGSENTYRDFRHPKVINFLDFQTDNPYGPAIRFTRAMSATADVILFMDDDVLHNEDLIHEMYQKLVKDAGRNTIYGCVERGCDSEGYQMRGRGVVLTPVLMMKKSVLNDYMVHGWPKFEPWMLKNRGNGEDLSINIFIRNYYNESSVFIPPRNRFRYWDKKRGVSYKPGHRSSRVEFCKLYHNTTFEL